MPKGHILGNSAPPQGHFFIQFQKIIEKLISWTELLWPHIDKVLCCYLNMISRDKREPLSLLVTLQYFFGNWWLQYFFDGGWPHTKQWISVYIKSISKFRAWSQRIKRNWKGVKSKLNLISNSTYSQYHQDKICKRVGNLSQSLWIPLTESIQCGKNTHKMFIERH